MRITRWAEYGIICCLNLARKNDAATATEISEQENIPLQYTHQILQRLRKGDVITSIRGPSGGYHLTKPASEITLRDILIAVEGKTFEIICEYNPIDPEVRCAENSSCVLRGVWFDLQSAIDKLLSERTLADILRSETTESLVQVGTAAQKLESIRD